MKVDFYWFAGCPSHDIALERLRKVFSEEGIELDLTITEVKTEEQAQRHRFIGSPTIRIEGVDINPPPKDMPHRLTCRTYVNEEGRISPLPSEELIRKGVRKHRKEPKR